MREIKFRFWNEYDSRMIEFDFDDVYGGKIEHAHLNFILHKDKVMQFTEVKDVNGVDIYEGDFLHELDPCQWKPAKVAFKDGSFEINLTKRIRYPINERYIRENELVIVGNIHQNPELITGA